MLIDIEYKDFGKVLDFNYPMREHFDHKLGNNPPRPKFSQE